MSADHKYNGWTNYETWAANLWMDNDESSYDYWRERTLECIAEHGENVPQGFTKAEWCAIKLREVLKDVHEDMMSAKLAESSLAADLLGAALSEINWYEIATTLIEDEVAETA